MVEIISQIDVSGNLNPSWVLSGITVVAGFLIWNQVRDIKEALKSMASSIKDINKLMQVHDKDIALINRDLRELKK